MTYEYKGENNYGYLFGNEGTTEMVDVVTVSGVEKANWFALTIGAIGGFFADLWNSALNGVKGIFS